MVLLPIVRLSMIKPTWVNLTLTSSYLCKESITGNCDQYQTSLTVCFRFRLTQYGTYMNKVNHIVERELQFSLL